MDRRIQLLEARVEQLERRLGRTSRNSSSPPSEDPPGASPRRRGKDRSGRPQGGQSGHEGHGRELLPAWAVDELVDHWPGCCGCGHVFTEADRVASREPARHQVEELPQIAVRVTEHRCQRVCCPSCGTERTGELPAEVAGSSFGPRLRAAVATLSVRNPERAWEVAGLRRPRRPTRRPAQWPGTSRAWLVAWQHAQCGAVEATGAARGRPVRPQERVPFLVEAFDVLMTPDPQ